MEQVKKTSSIGVVKAKERLWNKNFIKIFVIAALCGISMQMIGSTLPYYVIVLGGSPSKAGLMTGIMTVVALMSRPIVGMTVDTKGRKPVTITGMFIFLSGTVTYLFFPIVGLIIVMRVVQGAGLACISTANGTIAADVLPQSRLAEGIAYYGLSNTSATAIGPALALSLMTGGNYSPMFITSMSAMLIAFIIMTTLTYEKDLKREKAQKASLDQQAEQDIEVAKRPKEKLIWRMFERSALAPSSVVVVIAIGMSAVVSFLPSFAITKGVSNPGVFFTTAAITMLFVRVGTSRLFGRVSTTKLLVPSLTAFSTALFLISFLSGTTHLLFCAVLYGLGMGSALPIMNALVVKNAPPDKRGSANATYFSSFDIGMGLGASVWGFVIDNLGGYVSAFRGASVFGVVALVMSIFILGKKSLV